MKEQVKMYLRPKPGENEDDLLRMQEEFFQKKKEKKIEPAAKVIGTSKSKGVFQLIIKLA